jgi:hypothetical protein
MVFKKVSMPAVAPPVDATHFFTATLVYIMKQFGIIRSKIQA